MFKLENLIGLLGLGILQANAFPFLIAAINGDMPPTIAPAIMVFIGLACYQYRAIIQNDMLYIIGNTIGMVSNAILIILFFTM